MTDTEMPEALPTEAGASPAGEEPPAPPESVAAVVRHRHPFYLRGRRPRMPRSRRGLVALLMILAAFGGVSIFTGVSLIHWTETADFCGRCHTMTPELQAYEAGPHRDVACAECHVEPGIPGWVKAKINGTKQLIEVVLGTFPTPIPPPDHADLPAASDTCQNCHDVKSQAVAILKTRTMFSEDQTNTRQFVGLLVRPGGGDVFNVNRSVHWHVLQDVSYYASDPRATKIDYVRVTQADGSVVEYISQDKVKVSQDVQPDIDAIVAADRKVTMTCYDCHNRAGHNIANPRTAIDQAMSTGQIDAKLPFIKREAMRILWSSYSDVATADFEADKLQEFYQTNYPGVAASSMDQIQSAIAQIKVFYRLTATPQMKVTAKTYPNHLGHLDFPGCFRCHDGGHSKVVDGVATKEVIPATCDTCHTFPQIGPAVASLPLGEPPATHKDNMWVFSHKGFATDVDPGGQSCGECHARDYCVNCHSTGAVTVQHDEMSTNHAAVIRRQGNNACAYCHQPVYCARCHKEPVLPITVPFLQGSVEGPATPATTAQGVSRPLAGPHS